MAEETDRPDRADEAMLRVFLLWLLEADEAIAHFDDELAEHRQRLDDFERTLADDSGSVRSTGPRRRNPVLASLALEWGLRFEPSTSPGRHGRAIASRTARRLERREGTTAGSGHGDRVKR